MIAVIGSPNSGKSIKAEELALNTGLVPYYLATMKVLDDEGISRVKKHRDMRDGKGFTTIEIPYRIEEAPGLIEDPKNSVILLECMANLVGNAMHEEDWYPRLMNGDEQAACGFVDYVTDKVKRLDDEVASLIVVSSEYEPEDTDDAETTLYKRLLHEVNAVIRLFSQAEVQV